MSQGVNKLKELLFDREARAITDLEHAIERVSKTAAGHRTQIEKRLDTVFARSGTQERFRSSVAGVIDGALRDAELERHSALSDAIAPVVVDTVKVEIANSQDELVEALYPMTGRMVKAYVASAIKDLTRQINSSLERNPLVLRLNSLMTGRSVAELALADAQALEVEELYLIRRGSGELLARWPKEKASSNRDQVMSGILTAINEFAIEAFNSQGTALRQIDLGDSQVYLRGSPSYLLAAKCTGTATPAIEQTIDREFLTAIETHHDISNGKLQQDPTTVLAELAERLTGRITTYYEQHAAAGTTASPVKAILWFVGLAAVAWLGWTLVSTYLKQRTHAKAAYVLSQTTQMSGYPATIDTAPYGTTLTIAGLAPSPLVKHSLLDDLRAILPTTRINDQLTVVNSNFPDHGPELSGLNRKIDGLSTKVTRLGTGLTGLTGNVGGIETEVTNVKTQIGGLESGVSGNTSGVLNNSTSITSTANRLSTLDARLSAQAITRAASRASIRLRASLPDISRLSQNLTSSDARQRVHEAQSVIEKVLPSIDILAAALNTDLSNESLSKTRSDLEILTKRINNATSLIAPVLNPDAVPEPTTKQSTGTEPLNLFETAESLALNAEHFATLATAASQASAMRAPPPRIATPRERLETWTRANAIFFATGTDFSNSRTARAKLKKLAQLAKKANTLVRLIGFTDEKGALSRNTTLSLARAAKVRAVLISNGVRANTLIAVGRNDTQELSPTVGERSPNRRVQFELGFIGERSR